MYSWQEVMWTEYRGLQGFSGGLGCLVAVKTRSTHQASDAETTRRSGPPTGPTSQEPGLQENLLRPRCLGNNVALTRPGKAHLQERKRLIKPALLRGGAEPRPVLGSDLHCHFPSSHPPSPTRPDPTRAYLPLLLLPGRVQEQVPVPVVLLLHVLVRAAGGRLVVGSVIIYHVSKKKPGLCRRHRLSAGLRRFIRRKKRKRRRV